MREYYNPITGGAVAGASGVGAVWCFLEGRPIFGTVLTALSLYEAYVSYRNQGIIIENLDKEVLAIDKILESERKSDLE